MAINTSDVYLDNGDYRQAIKWADKATDIDSKSADALGQKVRFIIMAGTTLGKTRFTNDDRLVAKLAYDYFMKAEKGDIEVFKSSWLKENEKDILYGKSTMVYG